MCRSRVWRRSRLPYSLHRLSLNLPNLSSSALGVHKGNGISQWRPGKEKKKKGMFEIQVFVCVCFFSPFGVDSLRKCVCCRNGKFQGDDLCCSGFVPASRLSRRRAPFFCFSCQGNCVSGSFLRRLDASFVCNLLKVN